MFFMVPHEKRALIVMTLVCAIAFAITFVSLVSVEAYIHSPRILPIINIITLFLIAWYWVFFLTHARRDTKHKQRVVVLAKELDTTKRILDDVDAMKSEFIATASHQLRAPLTAIRGYSSLLLESTFGKLPKRALEPIMRIEQSSRSMSTVVDNFLNIAKIEHGSMQFEKKLFSAEEVVSTIVDEQRRNALKLGLVLLFRSDIEHSAEVRADEKKLRQIIIYLIENAFKYTVRGKIIISVREDRKKHTVFISIIDTGIGMNKDEQHKIFDKFVRGKNAKRHDVLGSGLGLYIARKMAEAMHGTIEATSPGEGKGSTFTITLPLVK